MTDPLPNPDFLDSGGSEEQAATVILRGGLIEAAKTIVATASGSHVVDGVPKGLNKLEYDAARYIVDRHLGPVGKPGSGTEDPWERFLDDVNADVEDGEMLAEAVRAKKEARDNGDIDPTGRIPDNGGPVDEGDS